MRFRRRAWAWVLPLLAALFVAGCAEMQASRPIMPVKEYEKLIVGRMDADYIGDQACLAKCHEHDNVKQYLEASTMGAQLSPESGLPLVNCESCHGPGSLAVARFDNVSGKEACDRGTFINLGELPKQAQSLICLKCHSSNATFNLHNWNASAHNMSGVSCFDCHNVHQGADLKVHADDISKLCYKCHSEVKAQFALPNHHAVPEGKVYCTDCHDPHGTDTEYQLKEFTVKDLCTNCHAEKEGPFIYEHGDVMEDCRICHKAHGSVNNNLLTLRMPFLCKQCHAPHRLTAGTAANAINAKKRMFANCTDCHSQIHGSDDPSYEGGTFLQ